MSKANIASIGECSVCGENKERVTGPCPCGGPTLEIACCWDCWPTVDAPEALAIKKYWETLRPTREPAKSKGGE